MFDNEIKLLCDRLGLSQEELHDRIHAYKTHVEPKEAAGYAADYLGAMMINQTPEEQNKMLLYVIQLCTDMLIEE